MGKLGKTYVGIKKIAIGKQAGRLRGLFGDEQRQS
jgi:hypothetical protein